MTENKVQWGALSGVRAGTGRVAVVSVHTSEELRKFVRSDRENEIVLLPIGKGTNLVGSDRELSLVCLQLGGGFRDIAIQDDGLVTAGCGMLLTELVMRCADLGLGGLSALAGIPGTLGGGLAGNAGANGHSIFEYIVSAEGVRLDDGSPWRWADGDGGWGYRCSPVPAKVMLTSATLRFSRCNPVEEHALQTEVLARRRSVAATRASLGSTFRNPENAPPAGKLLEEAGCKGLSCGVFAVSEHHANWIVNNSGSIGSAEDYRRLVNVMKQRVLEHFGIALREEVRFVDDLI